LDNVRAGRLGKLGAVGPSEQQTTEVNNQWETFNTVVTYLQERGIRLPDKPNTEIPEITEEVLGTTDNREYTRIYAQQLAWANYLGPLLAWIRAELLQYENRLDLLAPTIKRELKEGNKLAAKEDRLSQEEITDRVELNPGYLDVKIKAQELKQKRWMVESMLDNLERGMKVTSRQVEIRRQELEGTRTASSLPQRTPAATSFRRRE
jgi:hypothetical protein